MKIRVLKVSVIYSLIEGSADGFLGAMLAHDRIARVTNTFLSEMLRHYGIRVGASALDISICKKHAEHFSTLECYFRKNFSGELMPGQMRQQNKGAA